MELQLLIVILGLVFPALIAALAGNLLRSAIALLVLSVGVTLAMFNLGAPWAAVFELSVCAGLITVLFILTISMIRVVGDEEKTERKKMHLQKFIFLPVLIVAVTLLLWFTRGSWLAVFPMVTVQENSTVSEVLWQTRGMDLIGQIIILLAGVYGVVVLFKRGKINE